MNRENGQKGLPRQGVAAHSRGGAERQAKYIALIVDGHRRWAAARGLPVAEGYQAGFDTALARVLDARELGIQEMTIFAWSTESWRRSDEHVQAFLEAAERSIAASTPVVAQRGVRMRFIGVRSGLPSGLVDQMRQAEELTASNCDLKLFLAVNYSGRQELEDAVSAFAGNGDTVREHLYAPEMHDPDLLIRTGGDMRLSNFMLWQLAYTELVFRDEHWPDFDRSCFEECLAEFETRRRRFGGD